MEIAAGLLGSVAGSGLPPATSSRDDRAYGEPAGAGGRLGRAPPGMDLMVADHVVTNKLHAGAAVEVCDELRATGFV